MAKNEYNTTPAKKKKLLELVASDEYTKTEMAKIIGVIDHTINNWLKNPNFKAQYEAAYNQLLNKRTVQAKKSLHKLVAGYEFTELKEENGETPKGFFQSKTTTKKHFKPDTAAVIFALCNLAPEEFQNTRHVDVKSGGEKIKQTIIIGGKEIEFE